MLPVLGAVGSVAGGGGGGYSGKQSTELTAKSSATNESYQIIDNTFVVGGRASVDKGSTGFGLDSGGTNPLLLVGIAAGTLLVGFLLRKA